MFWRLSDAAEADLVEISAFVARQDPRAAARILDLCLERFDMFVRQPLIGEPCDYLVTGLRQFTAGRYVIFYRIADETNIIEIVRVLHSARDLEAVMRKRGKHGDGQTP